MAASQWSFGNARRARPKPGEPLYTVEELAQRFGTTANKLRALMGRHPGLTAWGHSNGSSAAPYRNYYRMSDARRWWAALQEEKKHE